MAFFLVLKSSLFPETLQVSDEGICFLGLPLGILAALVLAYDTVGVLCPLLGATPQPGVSLITFGTPNGFRSAGHIEYRLAIPGRRPGPTFRCILRIVTNFRSPCFSLDPSPEIRVRSCLAQYSGCLLNTQ